MGGRSLVLFILFLFFLCFPISSGSQEYNSSTSLLVQEQVHAEVTIKYIKEQEDKSIDIFRARKGGHEVTGGKRRGRRAAPKRNIAMDHRPPLFFSAASTLFTGFVMLSSSSF